MRGRRRQRETKKKSTDDITSLIFKWTDVHLAVRATLSNETFRSVRVLFSSVTTDISKFLLNSSLIGS